MIIFIKSFNRAYYVDKCIRSIKRNVKGDYTIVVLDDGTPGVYLSRLSEIHPNVKILYSSYSQIKSLAITENLKQKTYLPKDIPWAFWRNSIQTLGSQYFVLLEDDFWLTDSISINEISKDMQKYQSVSLKLSWWGNKIAVNGNHSVRTLYAKKITPKVLVNPILCILLKCKLNNPLKFNQIMYRLGVSLDFLTLNLYAYYSVAGAIFQKDFWLDITSTAGEFVNEEFQLKRLLKYVKQNPKSEFWLANNEVLRTTFSSSATNKNYGPNADIDMPLFNCILSDAWMDGRIDEALDNAVDIPHELITAILNDRNEERCNSSRWIEWAKSFRNDYVRLGCNI